MKGTLMRFSISDIIHLVIILFVLSNTLLAQNRTQKIYLKDGSTIEGTIIAEDDSTLVVDTKYGRLDIWKSNIIEKESKQIPPLLDTPRSVWEPPKNNPVPQDQVIPKVDTNIAGETTHEKQSRKEETLIDKQEAKQHFSQLDVAQIIKIYLKDGSTIQGKIIAQDDSTLVLESRYGTLDIKKSSILKQEMISVESKPPAVKSMKTINLIDGSVLKGRVTYEDSDSLIIETSYGRMVIPQSQVKQSSKKWSPKSSGEEKPISDPPERPNIISESSPQELRHNFELFGGASFPMGDYGSTTALYAGYATTGFCAGLQYMAELSRNVVCSFMGMVNYNSVDETEMNNIYSSYASGINVNAGHWLHIWALGGLGFDAPIPPSTVCYGKFLVGGVFGNSPEMNFSYQSMSVNEQSASAIAIGYGFDFGFTVTRMDICFRYLTTEPEYSITNASTDLSQKFKQPTATILLTMGVILN
jgi:RNase P/RNase MRP subunit p29